MGIFKDEFGDVIAWRVVAASVVAVAAAVGVAFALFGPKGTEQRNQEDVEVIAPPATKADKNAGLRPWLASIEGSEFLENLDEADLAGLRVAIESWRESTLGEAEASIAVVEEPTVADDITTVRLRIEREGNITWIEATLAHGNTWQVMEKPEGFEPKEEERVPLVDISLLTTLMPERVSAEVSRQLAASGIEGAGEAWTTAKSVSTEGEVTRLTIWFPTQGEDPRAWDASFDESFGMLEIAPQDEVA